MGVLSGFFGGPGLGFDDLGKGGRDARDCDCIPTCCVFLISGCWLGSVDCWGDCLACLLVALTGVGTSGFVGGRVCGWLLVLRATGKFAIGDRRTSSCGFNLCLNVDGHLYAGWNSQGKLAACP